MNIFRFACTSGCIALTFISSACFAEKNIVTETYDTGHFPCDGTSLTGINYGFLMGAAPNADCAIGTTSGPSETYNIAEPNIEGHSTGVLHLSFDVPTTDFGFGVAQNVTTSFNQSVIIHLNRPGVGLLREMVDLTTTVDPFFVGARYDYHGPAIKTVTVSFSNLGGRFAIDNVTYFRPPGRSK